MARAIRIHVIIAAASLAGGRSASTLGGPIELKAASDGDVDKAVEDSNTAATNAWKAAGEVQANAKALLGGDAPLVKAEVAVAKGAADAAKKEDDKITSLLAETKAKVYAAAKEAATGYLAQVKSAAADAAAKAKASLKASTAGMLSAEQRAMAAAAPFKMQMLRGQAVVDAYSKRARALAFASNQLKGEGAEIAKNAAAYQYMGNVIMANRTLMKAHSLVAQAQVMEKEALQLQDLAKTGANTLPEIRDMAQAAATQASMMLPPPPVPL